MSPGVEVTRPHSYPAFVFGQRGFYGIGPYKVGDGWRSRDVVLYADAYTVGGPKLEHQLTRRSTYPAFNCAALPKDFLYC